jgi:hypothetical protein
MDFFAAMMYSEHLTFCGDKIMGKERDTKKEEKKQPTKDPKEKKQAKADKKAARESKYN